MTPPFEPGTLLWDLMGDIRMLAVFPGALIEQVMEPSVGQAVGEHSVYRTDPWGRAFRSIHSVMVWVYGGPEAAEEGKRLRKMHASINGDNYHALDRELYGWVHATAFERLTTMTKLFGPSLTDGQRSKLYDEFLDLGEVLGIKRELMPPNEEAYWTYFNSVVDMRLQNTETAQDVLDRMRNHMPPPPHWPRLLSPLWWPLGKALGRIAFAFTVATLPLRVQQQLGKRQTKAQRAVFALTAQLLSVIVPRLPERVRYLPYAFNARR